MRPDSAERDPYLDNTRFLLMLLVVVGHAIEPLQGRYGFIKSIYFFIYLFHMYAFTLVSGYLSRPTAERAAARRQLTRLLVPYLLFEVAYGVLLHLLQGTLELSFTLTSPHKHLWFLVSLLTWRILLPWATALRYPIAIAVVAALAGGLSKDIGVPLSLSRTLVFFPIFLVGYRLEARHFARLGRTDARLVAALVLIIAAIVAAVWAPGLKYDFIFGKHAYRSFGWTDATGIGVRALQLSATLLCTLAFLSLVPRRRLWFSDLGKRTIYSYLLHQAAIRIGITLGLYGWLYETMPGWATLALLLIASAVLHLLLSTRLVAWLTGPLVEPSPRQLVVVLAAAGLVLAFSSGLRSLNHVGARFAAASEVPRSAPQDLHCDANRCLPVRAGGLVLRLERRWRSARLDLGLTPGDYEIVFFRNNRRQGTTRVRSGGLPVEHEEARVVHGRTPGRAVRRGYDALLLRPADRHTEGWLAFLGP